jgi:archaellum component FlaC
MEQFIYPTLTAFFAALITWFFSRKSTELDNEIKSADFYRSLLDDAMKRLNQAIDTINERDEKIKVLMAEIELLTDELKKFKQLNGKHLP